MNESSWVCIKSLRNFAKKILAYFRYKRFIFDLDRQCRTVRRKKHSVIVLMATPTHGNLGDQAIVYAEREFLRRLGKSNSIIEVRNTDYLLYSKEIQKRVYPDDIIIIDGGGNLGTLWENEDDKIGDIISRFSDNKIVVFPQTCYYCQDNNSQARLNKNNEIYYNAKKLNMMFRDKASYEFAKNHFWGLKNAILVPDIVLSVKNESNDNKKRDGVLLCFRNDHEKIMDLNLMKNIEIFLMTLKINFFESNTVISKDIGKHDRTKALFTKWSEFANAKLVITDRLHGMIFAVINRTPCIALDNKSKKVSGTFEFIKECPYVICPEKEKDIFKAIEELYNRTGEYTFEYPFDKIEALFI